MRSFNQVVFDDVVPGTTTPGTVVYTDPKWNDLLGSADALSLHAVIDNVGANATSITVQIWHCADDRNFVPKNTAPEITASGGNLATNTTNSIVGSDGGGIPTHGYVRLAITFLTTGGASSAHVKIYAAGR